MEEVNNNTELNNTDKKLHISDVMKRIEELKIEYINLPKDKFYSKDTMKRRKEYILPLLV